MTEGHSEAPQERRLAARIRDPLTCFMIGAAQKVHTTPGMGFTESVYEVALEKEFSLRGIRFESQREYRVLSERTVCGTSKADLVVEGKAIMELKALSQFAPEHCAQVISYLKASGLRTGLLTNFGARSLQVKRSRNG